MAGEVLPSGSTNTQGLADWASPYITNYLGQAQALAQSPYQTYQGPLTAGQSGLQTQAFQGLGSLTVPSSIGTAADTAGSLATKAGALSYQPTTFTNQYSAPVGSSFDATQAQNYMNPYLQASLNPQLEEARRQSQITQAQNAGKMTQAGAFGGGRQAILDAETQRSLGTNLANITGQGYNTAFNNAQQQFNADQARKIQEAQFGAQYGSEAQRATEQSKQYGAGYGLQGLQAGMQGAQTQGSLGQMQNQASLANLAQQLAGGAQERGITAEGIGADLAEFEKQRQYPYQQVQFQRDMISGLPTGAVTNTPGQMSGIGSLLSTLGGGTAAASALGYKNVGELLTSLGLDLGQKS
jgi:hypothetical protein